MSDTTSASPEITPGFVDNSGGKPAFDIDFGALREQASKLMTDDSDASPEAVPATPSSAPAEVRVKGATTGQGTAEAKVETPTAEEVAAEEALADIDENAKFKVVVDGEETIVTGKELKSGYSRTSVFTKRMQQVAKDRETVQASQQRLQALETERQGLETFLRNPNAILNYVAREFGPQAAAALAGQTAQPQAGQPSGDPNELVSAAEARAIAAHERQAVEAQLQNVVKSVQDQIAQATQAIHHEQAQAKHAVAISSTLSDIFTTNPVLKSIPNAEDLIRFEVAKLQPQTEAEALNAFKQVSQGMVEDLAKHFQAQKKIQVVAQARQKLESKTIEPPGGSAPQLQPTNFKNADGQVDFKKVFELAKNYGG
jgi:hypothetical protein